LTRYQKARRTAAEIADTFGAVPQATTPEKPGLRKATGKQRNSIAVRTVDLTQHLNALADVTSYPRVRIFATWKGQLLDRLDIDNHFQPVSASRLREAIVDQLGLKLIELDSHLSQNSAWATFITLLNRHYMPTEAEL
jgi:hypothetical protein